MIPQDVEDDAKLLDLGGEKSEISRVTNAANVSQKCEIWCARRDFVDVVSFGTLKMEV